MRTSRRGMIAAAIAVAALVPVVAGDAGGAGAATSYDLRSYYPNPTLAFGGYYLEGFNYVSGDAPAVGPVVRGHGTGHVPPVQLGAVRSLSLRPAHLAVDQARLLGHPPRVRGAEARHDLQPADHVHPAHVERPCLAHDRQVERDAAARRRDRVHRREHVGGARASASWRSRPVDRASTGAPPRPRSGTPGRAPRGPPGGRRTTCSSPACAATRSGPPSSAASGGTSTAASTGTCGSTTGSGLP